LEQNLQKADNSSRFFLGFPLTQEELFAVRNDSPPQVAATLIHNHELQSFESAGESVEPEGVPLLSSSSAIYSPEIHASTYSEGYEYTPPPEAELSASSPDSTRFFTYTLQSTGSKVPIHSDFSFQTVLKHIEESSSKKSSIIFKSAAAPSSSRLSYRIFVAAALSVLLLVLFYPFRLYFFNLLPIISNPHPTPTYRRPLHFLSTPKLLHIVRNKRNQQLDVPSLSTPPHNMSFIFSNIRMIQKTPPQGENVL